MVFFHTFVPFSMLVGVKIFKSTKTKTEEKKHGRWKDYNKSDYRDHVSTVADIYNVYAYVYYTYLIVAL